MDRAYYSMHHAAHAALARESVREPKTHKGLIVKFGEELVKLGKVDKELGRWLADAFDLRQKGTYEVYARFGEERVKALIGKAEQFIQGVKSFVGI